MDEAEVEDPAAAAHHLAGTGTAVLFPAPPAAFLLQQPRS